MKLKTCTKAQIEAQTDESNWFVWHAEILIVCLLVWLKTGGFIWGVLTLIGLGLLMRVPYVKAIMAISFTAVWVFLAWSLTSTWFELSTVAGICILVALLVGGLHIGVLQADR